MDVGEEVSGVSWRGPGLEDFGGQSEVGEDPAAAPPGVRPMARQEHDPMLELIWSLNTACSQANFCIY